MPSLRHDPVRTCVGCREEAGKRGLIRLVRGPDVHDDPACLELARKRRALQRALKSEVPDALWEDLTTAV